MTITHQVAEKNRVRQSPTDTEKRTLSDMARAWTDGLTGSLGAALHGVGIHPDAITFFGWVLVFVASVFIAQGQMRMGVLWLVLALPMDALDGAVARAMQRQNRFGAMLDSTLDRYADGFIFAALSYHFAVIDRFDMFLLAQAALIGAMLVSYTRARAEGLGLDCKVGWFTRMERIAVIFIMLLFPILLDFGVLLLAVGTNLTAIQRIWYVYQSFQNRGE
ncbi:MAG: CDP-alcohol phosphatidyltransferase family protein [Anaerolineae bacterium]